MDIETRILLLIMFRAQNGHRKINDFCKNVAAIMLFGNEDMFVLCNTSGADYSIPIERVIGMLNFEDKI